jgi:hypothetical protein
VEHQAKKNKTKKNQVVQRKINSELGTRKTYRQPLEAV